MKLFLLILSLLLSIALSVSINIILKQKTSLMRAHQKYNDAELDKDRLVNEVISNHETKLVDMIEDHHKELKTAREDAAKRSRFVRQGQDLEQLAPLVQGKYDHKDFRHIGQPVDYLIYHGAEEIKSKEAAILEEVIFLDIKTGRGSLNKLQRRIRDAIVEGRVRFGTYNMTTNEMKFWPSYEEETNGT